VRTPGFAEIYQSYFGFVWSITRYLGVEQAELDDIVQDIFITIHGRLSTLERPESLRSWIYSICRRTVSAYYRTKRRKLINTGTACMEAELDWATPQYITEQSEQVQLMWSLLEKLDVRKREIFVLVELEEMTAPEVAAAIGIPLNTVYSRARAARQELEEILQRHQARIQVQGCANSP